MNYCLYAQCVLSINTPDKNNKLCLYSVDLCIILVCIDGSKAPKSEEIGEKFEDTREGIRSSKSKDRQSNVEKTKRKTMIDKTVQRKQKIEQPTQITLKTEGELRCSGRVRSNCG